MINNFALIIGAMKCGTTSLFYYLSHHPQIAASLEKELHYFSNDRRLVKGMAWYQSRWNWKPNHCIALEASPSYTMQPKKPNVAERIAQVKDSQFRFIYIMRHPFDRIESHIRHQLSGKPIEALQIQAAKNNEANIAFCQYAMQLDAYTEIFGRDRLHLLLLEDLQKDPQAELRRVCQFLEIDPDYQFQCLDIVRNSRETLDLLPVLARMRHQSLVKPLVNLISPRFRQKLRKVLSRQESYNIKLSEQEQAIVLKQLQPDLARLQTEYGIDVQGKWGLSVVGGK